MCTQTRITTRDGRRYIRQWLRMCSVCAHCLRMDITDTSMQGHGDAPSTCAHSNISVSDLEKGTSYEQAKCGPWRPEEHYSSFIFVPNGCNVWPHGAKHCNVSVTRRKERSVPDQHVYPQPSCTHQKKMQPFRWLSSWTHGIASQNLTESCDAAIGRDAVFTIGRHAFQTNPPGLRS